MRIAVVRDGDTSHLAAIVGDRVLDLQRLAYRARMSESERSFHDLRSFLGDVETNTAIVAELVAGLGDELMSYPAVSEVELDAPFAMGAKIACHVVNYVAHGKDVGPPSKPFFFWKSSNAVVAPHGLIEAHAEISQQLDFEVELAVVVGGPARDVDPREARDCIAGYTILNDVSHRGLQFNRDAPDLGKRYGMNWIHGKSLDGSCPLGPWITLSDELPDTSSLAIRCRVNGTLRQDANARDMIFDVPTLMAEATRGVTFYPGDIIATGSPPGTALDDGGPFLSRGDVVSCEIEKIGTLENTVGE